MQNDRQGTPWSDDLERFAEALSRALATPELFVLFQPRFCLKTDEICAAEALVRWDYPGYGHLLATNFVAQAAKKNLICALDDFVLEEACRALGEWQAAGALPPQFSVVVNITGDDLGDPGFPDRVRAAIRRHGTSPARLRLELVEWTMIPDPPTASKAREVLGSLGVAVDMNYFAVGFSSLSTLKWLSSCKVGIHRSFIGARDIEDSAVVEATVKLFHSMGALAVAKRVETADELSWLKGLGCDEAQGFYLGRPTSPAVLETLLASRC